MITGITKRGEYSNNSMVKKHYTQMSKKEIQTLCNLYNNIDVSLIFTGGVQWQQKTRSIRESC